MALSLRLFVRKRLTYQDLNNMIQIPIQDYINQKCVITEHTSVSPDGNKLIRRTADGRAKVAPPKEDDDCARWLEVKSAQSKVDTHADKKTTHGVGSGYYLAKTSRSDQLPAWGDIQGKPSTFSPSSHSHPWSEVTGKPSSYPPSPHKNSHASGGSDPITPASIGAETPAGAQAKVDAHEAKPAPHSGHATKAEIEALYEMLYPIGTVYENAITSANPATYLGFGTWVPFGQGRVTVGVDTSQSEFNSVQKTGGAKTHRLTINEMPSHRHQYEQYAPGGGEPIRCPGNWETRGTEIWTTKSTGGGQPHNNLQPYITVYRWLRTA